MNQNWKKFLLAENGVFENDHQVTFPASIESKKRIYSVSNLAVLSISGGDAAKFLQGQMTCNIHEVTETKGGLGGFCNPKGRVITTFIIVRSKDTYYLVLPVELLKTVKNRLQMYILRSNVVINDDSENLCLFGTSCSETKPTKPIPADQLFITRQLDNNAICISFSPDRSLYLGDYDTCVKIWKKWVNQDNFIPFSTAQWQYLDVVSGIPWLSQTTTEEFIPQMLNLDKLGGVSFTKGCYTGQEVVARTHYLGKSKREMLLAECKMIISPEPNTAIFEIDSDVVVGRVLTAINQDNICKMLIVLQNSDLNRQNLRLQNNDQNKINILTL
jgi:tRNA-modifying protein YgfZ